MCQIMIDGVDLPGQSTSRLEIMVVPSPPNHWEYRDPTLCYLFTLKIFRKNIQLVDVKAGIRATQAIFVIRAL